MYTTSSPDAAPVGPHPFLCQNCERGTADPVCECGWTGCDCETCRQALRKERYAPAEFMHDVVRGFLVVGCAGGSRPPEEAPAPVEEPVAIEPLAVEAPSAAPAAPAAPSVPPTKTATASFRSMIRLCGLSHAEAAVELRQSESAIKKKSSGALASTEADMLHLVDVWQRIRRGDLEKLQPGSREAAAALRRLEE